MIGVSPLTIPLLVDSIRFAPPLVITEEDLLKGVAIIEESLSELDTVSNSIPE